MSAGRPTKYDTAYCEKLVEHMRDGSSVGSFCAEIDIARSTINLWASEHPEFMEALSRGKAKAQAWWEKAGRAVATGADGNATMCIFGMKNMGGDDWRDKQEVEHSGSLTIADRMNRALGRIND